MSSFLKISQSDTGFRLEAAVEVPRPRDEVFAFFSDATNLSVLTPPFLQFRILTPPPLKMFEGALIDYRIKLRGIPMRWRTEITAWEPPFRFVDVQRRGPYRRWRHEHRFTETAAGTLCEDRVDYAVLGGAIVHNLLVRSDVEKIFRFREAQLMDRFAAKPVSRSAR